MSRLSDLYKAMETLRKEGLPVNEDLEKKANELKEDIIKKEILPVLSKTIEPALQPVKRELVLVVDYVPGQPLSVHLSRKRNFASELTDAKEMVLDPEVTHRNHGSHQDEKTERGPARDMTVTFPDGTIIAEKKAVDTFVAVVKKIGVAKVRMVVEEYNLKFCKVPVISNRRDTKYGRSQKDLGDGWLLITHSNNPMKKSFIEKVSDILGLGIKVTLKG
ncbi:MAG: hypothetical protein J6B47_00925 [Prevotella sp.]|nr:hypothetical protein [Prevotella sp.]